VKDEAHLADYISKLNDHQKKQHTNHETIERENWRKIIESKRA
jgi:hypothetical protein